MNQAPTRRIKTQQKINLILSIKQIPTMLNKGSLFIRWYLKSSLSPFILFDGDTFRQVSGLVNVCSPYRPYVIGKELQGKSG